MAKRKKTRKDKMRADLRHQVPEIPFYSLKESSAKKSAEIKVPVISGAQTINNFFIYDFKKTFYLTFSILLAQFILFIFLRNHLINLPFITY